MKLLRILSYLYRYAKDLYETDGLLEKNRNESAQLKASAQILKGNIELLDAAAKLSAAVEQLGKNFEKLAATWADANFSEVEDQINEVSIRTRLISEHQVPNLLGLMGERNGTVSDEPGQPASGSAPKTVGSGKAGRSSDKAGLDGGDEAGNQ